LKCLEVIVYLLWEQDVGCSNHPAPTSKIKRLRIIRSLFFIKLYVGVQNGVLIILVKRRIKVRLFTLFSVSTILQNQLNR